ncbi:hypothetical protein [Leptolyngbya sp. ST-U4]|uniref:hypothetical protein n=1 Tax=Leptolyngbya sp. ST-U4 TaxID=2933912 RepID=UPI00329A4F50
MSSNDVNPSVSKVLEILREQGLSAEYWHSGGGNFGIMVWLPDDRSLLWGSVDGQWAYDYLAADNDYISSGLTELPEQGFNPSLLAQAIVEAVHAFT